MIVPRRRDSDQTFAAQMASFQFMGESNGVVFDEYMLGPYRNSLKGKPTFVITAKPNGPATIPQIDLYKRSDLPALPNLEGRAY